ncbi:MAG: PLP-dependent aminotransferase family protein [Clostridium sp.]|uniref:MocR-like pyridoxine biosynthesis transcription factor PdxR n=1 Tax=Clostridium sp. TaxID=1506 RepID=UPI002908F75A|nr:PLP-dependent aminotransferase family protein [Clostridium sp.]MDU7336899.1 PLP-dependent aminotransferase family protein [Clostridium sp.]
MNEINLQLNKQSELPLFQQLYDYFKQEIISGNCKKNEKMPSKRQLSSYLHCSQNTIQAAYYQLVAEGYLISREKSGYYVADLGNILHMKEVPQKEHLHARERGSIRYDFSYQGVDHDSFPFSIWRKLTKEVINEYDRDLLKAGDPKGDRSLRESIAHYLHYSRGVNCSAEQIIISSGTEFLLQLLIQLFDTNFVYGIENPGYEKLNMIFKSNRANCQPVELDDSGMRPDSLRESLANVACVTPSHQFPTGMVMPVSRRIQLLNWANEAPKRYLIEDDYDSEFRYSGKPIPSLQGMDETGRVIYMGAFSKSLSPALRVSYMVLPLHLLSEYEKNLRFYICPVPKIDQKTLCRFMDEGYFERHLNRMRNLYKQKREAIVATIHEKLPQAEIRGDSAGLHFLLRVNNGWEEADLIKAALKQGVRVFGVTQYYFALPQQYQDSLLLLGFASLKTEEMEIAVNLLKEAWHKTQ